MNSLVYTKMLYPFVAIVVVVALFFIFRGMKKQIKVSEFGKYEGYSEVKYDGNKRFSDYLTLSDGRKLAYDLILPTKRGIPATEPLPVLFKYTPYLRTFTIFDKNGKNKISGLFNLGLKERAMLRIRYWLYDRGHLMDPLFRTSWLKDLLKEGYAIIVVERPGTGASYGIPDMSFEPAAREGNEILNWIASKPWCDGNIGMYGDSFQAMVQFAIAGTGNPHLKAIFPTSSPLDNYNAVIYRGGVYNKAFASFFSWATSFLESVITPVDNDKEGVLLAQARKERSGETLGETSSGLFKRYPFRDSIMKDGTNLYENHASLIPYIERINRSGIPVYMTNGWYDIFTEDMFFWYNNLTVPKRLIVRPVDHSEVEKNQFDLHYAAEAHRWFDRWLKEIKNGIMDEPTIYYYRMGMPEKQVWRTSTQWPLKMQESTRFYFGESNNGTGTSINDGLLTTTPPANFDSYDIYSVDYTTTSGKKSRWTAVNRPRNYADRRPNDKNALTFTTPPLETDLEITGHPIAHLWIAADAPDLDLFVYLEEVDRKGTSTYITEGSLRASHRKLSQAPFNNFGLPYHSHYQSDLEKIPHREPVSLIFSLLPTSYLFHKGCRIRIAVACADTDNFDTPVINPAPIVHLLRDKHHASCIQLPVIRSQ